jgi:magnesium chelatase family protein
LKKILCATVEAINAVEVEVEGLFTKGLPSFNIVGLGSNAILESRDRVRSSLIYSGFTFPPLRITINLSPSDIKKSGSHFDLAIALIIALQKYDNIDLENIFVFGELGLDGKIKHTNSIFTTVVSLAEQGIIKNVLTSKESANILSKIPNINIYAVDTLLEAIDFFYDKDRFLHYSDTINYNYIEDSFNNKFYYIENFEIDFADVVGQVVAKRAALISASGLHNILLEGSPGCGKSMIIKRLKHILPPLSFDEILQIARIESADNKTPKFEPLRPFRSPHHSSTRSSIFGGGSRESRIGEVALANNGILYFDELPHFDKNILEAMREPLEDYRILVSRVNNKIEYNTKFLFAASQNPCPCGNLLSKSKECKCTQLDINRYRNKLSEPLLDRIDIFVTMSETDFQHKNNISSKDIFEQVKKSFLLQKNRGQKNLNGKMSEDEIKKFCLLDRDTESILQQAINRFGLSFRSINKILRVSRTIADLENSKNITKSHLLEAMSYRRRAN